MARVAWWGCALACFPLARSCVSVSRERSGAFDLAARVGEKGRGKAAKGKERSAVAVHRKLIEGAPPGGASLAGLRDAG